MIMRPIDGVDMCPNHPVEDVSWDACSGVYKKP